MVVVARTLSILIYGVVAMFIAAWLAQATGAIDGDGDAIGAVPPALRLGACVAVGVLGIVIGTITAVRLYSTRELR
ncbi:hypothetical protein [Microbacterium sp. Root553]|uniref:hypothetical protein n=1 Tax=Microbacterium sp. Root553 TaxID=1736556 RepID=UPI0006F479AD|nr:hypothetical protein [Microbacterium sp. Root553]KQZ24242.1 hypothetical protein ASD43_07680 [Microbacterium sp. Root553]